MFILIFQILSCPEFVCFAALGTCINVSSFLGSHNIWGIFNFLANGPSLSINIVISIYFEFITARWHRNTISPGIWWISPQGAYFLFLLKCFPASDHWQNISFINFIYAWKWRFSKKLFFYIKKTFCIIQILKIFKKFILKIFKFYFLKFSLI